MVTSSSLQISSGTLKKWTNYVSGWQDRYFEIDGGSLRYFKSKEEKSYGCRGSLALKSVNITDHEFNDCEFTVSVGSDIVWYLKAENSQEKELWTRAIIGRNNDSDYSSTSTKTHSRNTSLNSMYFCEKLEDDNKLFASRLSELEAYRTMCCDQMSSLLRMVESLDGVTHNDVLPLKATHLALLNNINHIIELLKTGKAVLPDSCISTQPSDTIKRPPSVAESERESETTLRMSASISNLDITSDAGEEWHDADEHSSLGSIENGVEARASVSHSPSPSPDAKESDRATVHDPRQSHVIEVKKPRHLAFEPYDSLTVPAHHPLYDEIDQLAKEQLKYALAGVEDNIWTLFAEDGAMRMYTREIQDEGGLPVDPLKAVHEVKGVSALEFMHYFYDAQYKMDWDHTLNDMKIVEHISKDAVVLHQKHKTVWPAAPRESLFVSHIRRVDSMKRENAHDLYIVCNKDVQRHDVPVGSSSSVRVGLTVSMICETVLLRKKEPHELTREDVLCNIIYVSQVHPGGWVPTAALRHVYKKEYPKFLRTFTDYVLKNVKGKPLTI